MRTLRTSIRDIVHGATPNHEHFRDRLVLIWSGTIFLDVIFSVLALLFEKGRADSEIFNYGDALFWTTTQLLTVSSQLKNPVTPAGRVLDVLMQVVAITIIATQAGSAGSFLYRRSVEINPSPHHQDPGDASTQSPAS